MRKFQLLTVNAVVLGAAIHIQAVAQTSRAEIDAAKETIRSRYLQPLLQKQGSAAIQGPDASQPNADTSSVSAEIETFDLPIGNTLNTGAIFIDAAGRVIGSYLDSNAVAHGFVRQIDGSLTTIDVPGAGTGLFQGTGPVVSNDFGVVTGSYTDANNFSHGFVLYPKWDGHGYDFAHVLTIDDPLVPADSAIPGTFPASINNEGEVTGTYYDANGTVHAFLASQDWLGKYPAKNIVEIDAPGATTGFFEGTSAWRVTDFGVIAGTYQDAANNTHAFTRDAAGNFTEFDVPTSGGLYPYSAVDMNNRGQVTGSYFQPISGNPFGGNYRGFIRSKDGEFQTFDAATYSPCCIWTFPHAINSTGQVAGDDNDGFNRYHGFFRDRDGSVVTFDAPGAGTGNYQGTHTLSINASGAVAGYYTDANYVAHGFIRRPKPHCP